MNMNEDVRKQLMEMAGISDPAEFDRMVRELAPSALAASAASPSATGEAVGTGATERANKVE